MEITLPRPATSADVPAVEALVAAAYGHYVARIGVPPLPMVDDYPARVAAGQVWVVDAPDGGGPDDAAGPLLAVVVLEEEPDHLEVDNVAVHPGAQGRGLGRALLDFAHARALAAGLPELRLMTNELMIENQAIYEHLGWRRVGGVVREGRRAVRYAKPVTPGA
ncbi:GNAT family N-acetyltransferase [Kineosporia sp. R_H_3]|uniref:GNAT family N-acetyltransferase n=1 Tax=Kineosporia sp. R_H_3 TaxID=1961848 RepID=UPI0018E9FBA4|nr:GNAT family N-acetyltransferase [Kineosporia sp. R_H_3]